MGLTCVALGLDHRHIYGMTENMAKAGVTCLGYWTEGDPETRRDGGHGASKTAMGSLEDCGRRRPLDPQQCCTRQ